MKKNTMMRIASVLMVAVLLSTCAISSTFAKYVSSDSAKDTARIAKWGVTVTASGDNAFAQNYDEIAGGTKVVSSTSDNVIAPGTNGTLGGITITGSPEVMVNVTASADLVLNGWKVDDAEYCPIIFTVGEETYGTNSTNAGNTYDSIFALETAIEEKFTELIESNIAANTNLLEVKGKSVSVSWSWPIGISDDVDDDTNKKDTALGDIANNALTDNSEETKAPTIYFECSASVTRVD